MTASDTDLTPNDGQPQEDRPEAAPANRAARRAAKKGRRAERTTAAGAAAVQPRSQQGRRFNPIRRTG